MRSSAVAAANRLKREGEEEKEKKSVSASTAMPLVCRRRAMVSPSVRVRQWIYSSNESRGWPRRYYL